MSREPLNAQHPAREILDCIELMAASPAALTPERREARFNELALELFAWQFERNEPYRKLCVARQHTPAEAGDWTQIPTVPTAAFKDFEFSCLPATERETVFHSSGTSGQKPSRHFHNGVSLELYHASLLPWFRRHFPKIEVAPHLLSLTPSGRMAPHSSLVHMLEVVRAEVCSLDSWFAGGVHDNGAWALEPDKVVAWLNRYTVLNQAVIVAGTAFNFVHLVDWMISRDARVHLPPGSAVMETGGYKGRSRNLPQAELHALICGRLGVAPDVVVCEYGMCELSSQASDRMVGEAGAARLFRFPPWARVRVVSSENGQPAGEGKAGLLQICDLANAFSVLAIQTEDLAVERDGGFELIGRAEAVEPRGCSLLPA
jgi:hypothetical protein